jgi:hypothetical protein
MHNSVTRTTGNEDGSFQFRGLAPGDYRIFAVPLPVARKLERPNVLESLAPEAEEITLEEGGVSEVALTALDI